MHRELFHLYGPLAINSFGLMIILGIIIFSILILRDPKRPKLVTTDQYFNILSLAIVSALMGGRALYLLENWQSIESFWEIFAFWEGGFSLLGGIIALLVVMPFYFKKHHLNAIAILDLAAIYAPLLQAISRLGCFFAGCCFGHPTDMPFGIISPTCGIPVHPTQLYSAGALFIIFCAQFFWLQKQFKYPGQLICIYLLLMSVERFILDFWRGDRAFTSISFLHLLSLPQLVALTLAIVASAALIYITFIKKHKKP